MSTDEQRAEWKRNSKSIIGLEIGDSVIFTSPKYFTPWGLGQTDPSLKLENGKTYIIEDIEIRSYHSVVKLAGYKNWYSSSFFNKKGD